MPPLVPPIPNQPLLTVVAPVYAFAPDRIQVPPSVLVTPPAPIVAVKIEVISLASVLRPRSVSVLAPVPVMVRLPILSGPLPLESMVAAPVVLFQITERVTVSPAP